MVKEGKEAESSPQTFNKPLEIVTTLSRLSGEYPVLAGLLRLFRFDKFAQRAHAYELWQATVGDSSSNTPELTEIVDTLDTLER